jgi:ubiquinone/menaquinone biosynthesis C-methylase UbiE
MQGARRYDLQMWLRTLGRERTFRRRILDLAHLAPGEDVLDLGSGTGSLVLAAKRRVGASGVVHGIDPSPEMVERARTRARRAGLDVRIEEGVAQELELPDESVDVVFAMLVLHHLPHDALVGAGREIRRILRPGGRFLAVDIDLDDARNPRRSPHAHAHRIGAHFDLNDVATLAGHVGLEIVESGEVDFRLVRFERMRYLLAARPADAAT